MQPALRHGTSLGMMQGVWGGASLKDMQASRFKGQFVSSGTTGGDIGQKPLIVAAKQPSMQSSLPPPPAATQAPSFAFARKPVPSAAETATAQAVCSRLHKESPVQLQRLAWRACIEYCRGKELTSSSLCSASTKGLNVMIVAQAIAAAQSIAARLSQQAGSAPTAIAPGSYGNQPYSYDNPNSQPSSLPGPPPLPISSSTGPQSDALAAAQAVAARLSAQSGLLGNSVSHSAAPGQALTDANRSTQPQQPESKQEAAIRAAEAVAARFSAQVAAPPAAAPASGNPYASTYGAANGHSINQSSSHATQAAPPHDPIAAAQAVAARLADRLGQSGQPQSAVAPQHPG